MKKHSTASLKKSFSHNFLMEVFVGKWKLSDTDKFDDYMKALGKF